jgi:aldose 1-epimerase
MPPAPLAPAPSAGPAPLAAAEPVPPAPVANAPARLQKALFGSVEGKNVELYTLTNSTGMVAKITTYGAILTELHVPDRAGKLEDVVLGFESLDGYIKADQFFGATAGRVANRIRNARFTLGGKQYQLAANDPPNHLHGGKKGFDKRVWSAEPSDTPDGPALTLTYVSEDGEEGYPGKLVARTVYTLTERNELRVDLEATTDRTTLVNLVHHSYWNLAGHGAGPITDHVLELRASSYTPGDPLVPTGAVKPVKGTPFDFVTAKVIGRDLRATGLDPVGFDHNFVVDGDPDSLRPVARVKDPKSGRVLTLEANQPGVQFYTGNFLNGAIGKGGAVYAQHTGFCLETQKFPNAVGVPAWQKQAILEPGQTYRHTMVHRFSAE